MKEDMRVREVDGSFILEEYYFGHGYIKIFGAPTREEVDNWLFYMSNGCF